MEGIDMRVISILSSKCASKLNVRYILKSMERHECVQIDTNSLEVAQTEAQTLSCWLKILQLETLNPG